MLTLSPNNLRCILCLGAHADDIEIGCGGTLLKLLDEQPGITVHWVVLAAEAERADEARRSADRLLARARDATVELPEFPDSFFPYVGSEIKVFFHQLSGRISPDLIFTHYRADLHQDHRLAAELTWNAFRQHLILEYEIPKYDGDLGQPNVYVPLEEAVCRSKIDSLIDSFPTQTAKPWFTPDTFWALLRLRGVECHSPTRFAEAFHARKVVWG